MLRAIWILSSVFVYLLAPSWNASAGTFRDGCKAILVVSGSHNELSFHESVSIMRQNLMLNGCRASDIQLVRNPDIDSDTTDGNPRAAQTSKRLASNPSPEMTASKANLEQAFANLRKDLRPQDRVFVMISGHAVGQKAIYIGDGLVFPEDLSRMLRGLDTKYPRQRILKQVVLDFCWSGSFVSNVTSDNTCVVTSQDSDRLSLFSPRGGNSFSYFLANAMASTPNLEIAASVADFKDNEINSSFSSASLLAYTSSNDPSANVDRISQALASSSCSDLCARLPECRRSNFSSFACLGSCAIERSRFYGIERNYRAARATMDSNVPLRRRKSIMDFFRTKKESERDRMDREVEDWEVVSRQLEVASSDLNNWINGSRLGRAIIGDFVPNAAAANACLREPFR